MILVNVQKCFLASISFTIWNIGEPSQKMIETTTAMLCVGKEILFSWVIHPCLGLYTCVNHEKICIKTKFEGFFLKFTATDLRNKRLL